MKNLLVILFLLFNLTLFAQEKLTQGIRGKVIDKHSQMTLIGASVTISESDPLIGAVTDIDGKFKLKNVPIGRITLKVSYVGYNDVYINNLEVTSSKEIVLSIEMEESVLEEVVISAQKNKDKPLNEMAKVSARTFSIEDSKRYAGSMNDVARMAKNFAGVTGGDDSRNDIIVRGNSPIGVLYRLEGVDIPNPNHFAAFGTTGGPISILNNNVLANSDFMTSAFPAEYGNALSAVFDLKMRTGNNENHEFLGQFGFNGIEFMGEGPLSKKSDASYLFSYRYSTMDLFKLMGINFGTASVPQYQDASFNINFPHKKGKTMIFGLGGISGIQLNDTDRDTTKEDVFTQQGQNINFNTKMGAVGLSHTHLLKKNAYLKAVIAFDIATNYIVADTLDNNWEPHPNYRNNSSQGKATLNVLYNKKFSAKHILRTGVILDRKFFHLSDSVYRFDLGSFYTLSDFEGGTWLVRPYGQWQYRVTNDLSITGGVHTQYFAFNEKVSVEPRFGMSYSLNKVNTFSLGYGLHSQLPPTEIFFEQIRDSLGNYFRANEHVGFTKSHHFVLAYDRRLTENTRIKIETYYQTIFNAAVDKKDENYYSMLNQGAYFGIGFPDYLVNTGTGENYGVEFTLERFLSNGFYYLFTGSLYNSTYKGSDNVTRNTAFNGNYAMNVLAGKEIKFQQKESAKKAKAKSLTIDGKFTYSGGQRYIPIDLEASVATGTEVLDYNRAFEERFDDYLRFDLRIGFKVQGDKITQEWAADLQNVTNQKNDFQKRFNPLSGKVETTHQIGFLPVGLYRIYF